MFSTSVEAIEGCLTAEGGEYSVERKRVCQHGEEKIFTHIHVRQRFPIELTMYAPELVSCAFKSSITGKAIEKATLPQFEAFIQTEYPDLNADAALNELAMEVDRFQIFPSLLLSLEFVMQGRKGHPEVDVLFHLLQCHELVSDRLPYDEEFLLAALLHDCGKGGDPDDVIDELRQLFLES